MRRLLSNRGHSGAGAHRTRLALLAMVAFALVFAIPALASAPRSGVLHVTKECSDYNGLAGGHCTITTSNLAAIPAGSKVFYLEAAGATGLDSDLVLYAGPGNAALGHVTLSLTTFSGSITFVGGTGRFRGFHAHVAVTLDQKTNIWHWDGTYRFGHDKH